jgi:hypothetical protein
VRQFSSGATRDTDDTKADPEGCFHPLVIKAVSDYMAKHSYLPNGTRRPADNWQKGMPRAQWRKSLERHWLDARLHDKGFPDQARETMVDALCAIIFNAQGRLLEELLGRDLEDIPARRITNAKRKHPLVHPGDTTKKPDKPTHTSDCPIKWGACCTCRKMEHNALKLQPDGSLKPFRQFNGSDLVQPAENGTIQAPTQGKLSDEKWQEFAGKVIARRKRRV